MMNNEAVLRHVLFARAGQQLVVEVIPEGIYEMLGEEFKRKSAEAVYDHYCQVDGVIGTEESVYDDDKLMIMYKEFNGSIVISPGSYEGYYDEKATITIRQET